MTNSARLTDQQHQIHLRTQWHTQETNRWLTEQGLNPDTVASTDIRLLQAQQQAHTLLTQHRDLLTDSQRTTLERFGQQMQQRRTRTKLKPAAAYTVLNISSRINRQLFRQHRQLKQA